MNLRKRHASLSAFATAAGWPDGYGAVEVCGSYGEQGWRESWVVYWHQAGCIVHHGKGGDFMAAVVALGRKLTRSEV